MLLECGRELADARDDVRSGCQRETRDIGVTLFRRRTELPHRTKDDYPLPSATGALQELDRGPCRSGVGVVGIVDQGDIADLLPGRAHLRLRHPGDARGCVLLAHPTLASN